LARFDAERRDLEVPGRQLAGGVVRRVDSLQTSSDIMFSSHGSEEFDTAVREEMGFFHEIGHDLEWKTYAHDAPAGMCDRLRAIGFDVGPEEAVLVAAVERVLEAGDPGHDVCRVTGAAGLEDYMLVRNRVWPDTPAGYADGLAAQLRDDPDGIGLCIAYMDDTPVGSARSSFLPGSWFSGLWGGAVVEAYRGRGIYRSMVAHRARDAVARGVARGVPWLRVDALPTSRPILERLGFVAITTTRPCLWPWSKGRLL
jgi:GNAT superfamily N-acetyltransferase